MATSTRAQRRAAPGPERRRSSVLSAIAQNPCALDVIVWVSSPLVPAVLDRLFEACASEDPPLRWALLGPREDQLRRKLMQLHATMPDMPLSFMPDHPVGCNPYIIPVGDDEVDIFQRIVSRAILVLNLSQEGMPAALRDACAQNFVDVIDTAEVPAESDDWQSVVDEILEGGARVRGSVVRLGGESSSPLERAGKTLALIRAAAQLRGYAPHVCDGCQLCTAGMCSIGLMRTKTLGAFRARL